MLDLDLHQLKVFHSVARYSSYSKAGEMLALSQPAVSRQVANLERTIGLELFTRRGRQVMLTDAGRSLYDYADRIYNLAEQARRAMFQFKDLERGEVLLGASTTIGSYILPALLQSFRERYPNIEISLETGNSAAIEKLILAGAIDLGFIGMPAQDPKLHVEPHLADELVLAVPPDHPFKEKKEISPADFAGETLIWREKGSATRAATEAYLSAHQIKTNGVIEIGNNEAIKRLVAAGMGVAFISQYALTLEVKANLLKIAGGDKMKITRYFYLIFAKDRHLFPTALAFINFTRKMTS
jgi:DNA-binding transcriptional LysR family regulator